MKKRCPLAPAFVDALMSGTVVRNLLAMSARGLQGRGKGLLVASIAGLVVCGIAPKPALASTATSTMAVSATVVATCSLSATAMAFGNYTSAVSNATATITATCSNGSAYTIGLSAGTASGATVTTRAMFVSGAPAVLLNYGLYQNATHATNWGTTTGTDTVPGTGNGAAQVLNVYGQIPAGQLIAAGSYADTITATITY